MMLWRGIGLSGVAVDITYMFRLSDIKFRRLMTLTLKMFLLVSLKQDCRLRYRWREQASVTGTLSKLAILQNSVKRSWNSATAAAFPDCPNT